MDTLLISGQTIQDDGYYYYVEIQKPIYGTCVAISDAIIKRAKQSHRNLILSCPKAKEAVTPDGWMKRSRMIKKVFRYPDNPMILWQGTIRGEVETPGLFERV